MSEDITTWGSREFPDTYVNGRGIPKVIFVDNVVTFLKAKGVTAETALRTFQEDFSKYKLMEAKLTQSKASLMAKLPEIQKTLEMLRHLRDLGGESMRTNFALSDTAFVEADVPAPQRVGLWLGANVMVEYEVEEAIQLLTKNLTTAKANLERTLEDLAYLREQHIVVEVNMARVYNHEVRAKKEAKEAGD